MVAALGPARFYGGGLPRPRFFPGDRVDPLPCVTDPLLVWARDAHWSMGGLSTTRLRLQGRIEGNISKLRSRARGDARAKAKKARAAGQKPASLAALGPDDDEASDGDSDEEEVAAQERALKRELVGDDEDSDDSDESEEDEPLAAIATAAKSKRARKLVDEFDRIAVQQQEKTQKAAPGATLARTSPRGKATLPAAAAPANKSLKRKASAPVAAAPARTSPRSKASAPAAAAPARASPRSKTSVPVAGARRTSPRNKH